MAETTEAPTVWTCDGCSSWTDRPVSLSVLLAEWGWERADDADLPLPPGEGVFCPDCL